MNVRIKRQKSPDSPAYWQSFSYDGPKHVPISALLDALNYTDDLYDIEGAPADRIRWECSCMQAMCGGCAMVINGTPALACQTFADEVKGEEIILEPLSKFPVIADLTVDRSAIYEQLIKAKAFLDGSACADKGQHKQQYDVAKCLKCGLCLEVCPNYHPGGEFYGALLANESYLIASQTKGKAVQAKKEYDAHFASGCSKALSCQSVCPMGIETLTSILRMNRK
jgi:succinate dehydrogenase / fumarate reductase iron-sulfur subunit